MKSFLALTAVATALPNPNTDIHTIINEAKPVVTDIVNHISAGEQPHVEYINGHPTVTWVAGEPVGVPYYPNRPYQYNYAPAVEPVVQPAAPAFDPLMLMMLTDSTGDDTMKNIMLLQAMNGNNMMGNNNLLPFLLMDSKSKSCEDEYHITDKAAANPSWKTGDANPTALEQAAVDYQYIGCVESDTDGLDFLTLMPFLQQNNGFNGIGGFDPLMMMLLMGDDSDSDNLLPLMMMNGNMFGQGGSSNMFFWLTILDKSCEVKHDIPDHYYTYGTTTVTKVTDSSSVKDHFKSLYSSYGNCVDDDNSITDLLPFLLMQQQPMV